MKRKQQVEQTAPEANFDGNSPGAAGTSTQALAGVGAGRNCNTFGVKHQSTSVLNIARRRLALASDERTRAIRAIALGLLQLDEQEARP